MLFFYFFKSSLVTGFLHKKWKQVACKNDRLWHEVGMLSQGRDIFLLWTKAHVTSKHILSGQVSFYNMYGNACADSFAKAGAKMFDKDF